MNRREFITQLFDRGKVLGLEEMEVYYFGNNRFDLGVFKGDIDKYSISDEEGISFRTKVNGKMGYSYTEKIDESSINMLIEEAVSSAKVIDSDDEEEIFQGSEHYKKVNSFNEELEKITPEQKIKLTKLLEQEALDSDSRVVSVNHCVFGEECIHTMLVNTKGLDLENKANIAYAYISVMVKEGEDVKTSGKYMITNDFNKFNARNIAQEASKEAISMLNADTIDSDEYPVILRNDVMANILEAFTTVFSAESVQKNVSLLKGKINKKIASDIVTIVDDPYMEEGIASSSFDGEGVATIYKKVIDKGVLKTYFHNSKTAKKDGIKSTGNAHKGSYKSAISITPTNMYIEKGDCSLDDMVKTIDKGILIIDVQGLHAGLDPVSGDFSLSAYGYEITSGKINKPINQITIAGNFFDMIKDIEKIGNDIKFVLPGGSGYIGSPSVKIRKLSVSGK